MTKKQHFSHPTLTIPEQIALLKKRGLRVPNEAKVVHYLNFIGYYRLSGYFLSSWGHALTYTRNLCAHHSRLWNRTFTIRPREDKRFGIPMVDIMQMGFLKDWAGFKAATC